MTVRNQGLDIVKGIGILLVFLGHSVWSGGLTFGSIFAFHMPLFFFVSGILFSPEKYGDLQKILRHVAMVFLVPYLVFNVMGAATWWLSQNFPQDLQGVCKAVYTVFIGCHPQTNGPTWFLVVLAEVQLATWFALRISKRSLPVLLAAAAFVYVAGAYCWSLWLPRLSPRLIPFRFMSAMLAFLYFTVGHAVAKCDWQSRLDRAKPAALWFMASVAISAVVLLTRSFGTNSISDCPWHPHLLVATSTLGIFAILAISTTIVRLVKEKVWRVLAYIGRNSLYYFTLEFVVGRIVWSVMKMFWPHLTFPLYSCDTFQGVAILFFAVNLVAVSAVLPIVKCAYCRLVAHVGK